MLTVIIITAIIISAIIIFAYLQIYDRAFLRGDPPFERKKKKPSQWDRFESRIKNGNKWFYSQNIERLRIKSFDGTELAGDFLQNPDNRGLMILVHGFHSEPGRDFGGMFRDLYEMGFSILAVHQRAHGDSDGHLISFGINERLDVLKWSYYMNSVLGDDCPTYLYGISMGATSALMASGLELPASVRGIIADCSFTTPYDLFSHEVKQYTKLNPKPVMAVVGFLVKRHTGLNLKEISTVEAMEMNTRPILFVHGSKDSFVPPEMTIAAYDACKARKELLIIDGAEHAVSYHENPRLYRESLSDFLMTIEYNIRHENKASLQ